jgi:hypothetical protein
MSAVDPWGSKPRSKDQVSTDIAALHWRVNAPASFDWPGVDGAYLRAAYLAASHMGKTISIGPAMGGRGVVVTYYVNKPPHPKKFAIDPRELESILQELFEAWCPSEDLLALCRQHHSKSDPQLAAD